MTQVITTHQFTEAKAGLSDLMTDVIRHQRPTLIDRHGGKENMLLLPQALLGLLVADHEFSTRATREGDEWLLFCPELNIAAAGETFDEALDDLTESAEAYARDFINRMAFFLETDRAAHLPWIMRLAACSDEDERRDLLAGSPPPQ